MWVDIKKWITYLYLATGLTLGLMTNVASEPTLKGLRLLVYLLISTFAWLPIIIAEIITKSMYV